MVAAYGHLNIRQVYPGATLYSWLYQQRKKYRMGTLPAELAARLAEIEPLWYDDRACLSGPRVLEFFQLTDESWARIEPMLPAYRPRAQQAWNTINRRAVIEGIIWKLRTGVRWDDLPEACGAFQTVNSWWWQWNTDGLWARIEQQIEVRGEASRAAGVGAA